ncbi:hypothetical protein NPIL_246681 [Nephila pilipes]|uniref:Uncharacterized protein n=1 Tax=Nephila pilipes TaxID=299642 RepID=A0A8X6U0U6_NEPPI|nr:hypothetical protein NPIL_246681 [Nephila pilipes]
MGCGDKSEVSGYIYDPAAFTLSQIPLISDDALSPSLPSVKNVEAFLLGPTAVTFVETFTQLVKSSNVLSQVFDQSETPGYRFYQFLYKSCRMQFINHGSPYAEVAAEICTLPIAQNFPNLPLQVLVNAFGYAMARLLLSEKILNESNAEMLALDFAKSFEDTAERQSRSQSDFEFWVLSKGFSNFTISQIAFTPRKGWRLAIYCAVTWMLDAVLYWPDLALAYAKSYADSAEIVSRNQNDYKFRAIAKGFDNFIKSQVEMTPAKGWRLAIYCGVTWMLNAQSYTFLLNYPSPEDHVAQFDQKLHPSHSIAAPQRHQYNARYEKEKQRKNNGKQLKSSRFH